MSELWIAENKPQQGLNFGNGTLQGLFCRRDPVLFEVKHIVSDKERMVAATVVQWLGTNMGRHFLTEAFRKAGWIIKMEPSAAVRRFTDE